MDEAESKTKVNKLFKRQVHCSPIDEETEDEEVKLNCIGGYRGIEESDFSSDSEEDDDDMQKEEEQRSKGVVQFSGGRPNEADLGQPIIRPRPERLSPHQENSNDESTSESSDSSVGARGAAISLGVSNDGEFTGDDADFTGDDAEDKSIERPANDDENDSDVEDDNGVLEEPSILPQQSILHQLEKLNNEFQVLGSQGSQKRTVCKTKRVLSSNTLAALNAEAGRNSDSPKRIRTSPESHNPVADKLPELSLGLSAMDEIRPLPRGSLVRGSPAFSNDDDEELDIALSEELKSSYRVNGDNSPVPLLTPPQSPLTIPTGDGSLEWPSNMVVDSAMMTAATITRPLSPTSLQKLDEAEEARLKDAYSHPEPSTLTPLLRSIYVGID